MTPIFCNNSENILKHSFVGLIKTLTQNPGSVLGNFPGLISNECVQVLQKYWQIGSNLKPNYIPSQFKFKL